MVGAAGFEPTTSSTPLKRATKLRHAPNRWHCSRERIAVQQAPPSFQLSFSQGKQLPTILAILLNRKKVEQLNREQNRIQHE